jgi:hypothetical protein
MLKLNGRYGPVGFALKMLEHFCPICVKLLLDEERLGKKCFGIR